MLQGGIEPCKVRGELLCFIFFLSFFDVRLLVCKKIAAESLRGILRALSTIKPKDLIRVLLCCQYFEKLSQLLVFYN